MKNLKKLISIILSINFLFVSTLSLSVLADNCPRNSKGGYIHPQCAFDDLLKVSKGEKDFVNVTNLGALGDEEHYVFNYRALDKVFEEKKLMSIKALNGKFDSLNKQCKESSNIWNKDNILEIIISILIGAGIGSTLDFFRFKPYSNTGGDRKSSLGPRDMNKASYHPTRSSQNGATASYEGINSHNNLVSEGMNPQPISQPVPEGINIQPNIQPMPEVNHPGRGGSILSWIGGLIGAITSVIHLISKKQNVCQQVKDIRHEIVETNKANEAKANMLNMLLPYLEHPEELEGYNMFYYVSGPDDYHCELKNAKFINYTPEEQKSFPKKFKEIAAKIRKNLEENNKLKMGNLLFTSDNTDFEENSVDYPKLGAGENEEL